VSLRHDVFLGANVFLLSRVHNVTLLQDLHGERLGLFALQLHLKEQQSADPQKD